MLFKTLLTCTSDKQLNQYKIQKYLFITERLKIAYLSYSRRYSNI